MPSAIEHETALLHGAHMGQADSETSEMAIPASASTAETRQHSRISNLPRELRDLIYESDLAQHNPSAYLDPKLGFITVSPLARINKHMRREYLETAPISVPVVEAVVRNFDFDHIISFIDALPAGRSQNDTPDTATLAADSSSEEVLEPKSNPVKEVPTRTIIIKLSFSKVNTQASTYSPAMIFLRNRAPPAQYRRWGDRINRWRDFINTNPKAAKVNFQYGARNGLPRQMAGLKVFGMMGWKGAAEEEVGKICKALGNLWMSYHFGYRNRRTEVESSEDEQEDDKGKGVEEGGLASWW